MAKQPNTNGAGKITFEAKLERETKGAVRYQELNAKGEPETRHVGVLYLRKTSFESASYPDKITVTIEQ